jgi:hypothetical protein
MSSGKAQSAKNSTRTVLPKRSQSSYRKLNDLNSWSLISLVGKSFLRVIRATHHQSRAYHRQLLLLLLLLPPALEPFRRRLLDQYGLQPLWHLPIYQSRPASLDWDG